METSDGQKRGRDQHGGAASMYALIEADNNRFSGSPKQRRSTDERDEHHESAFSRPQKHREGRHSSSSKSNSFPSRTDPAYRQDNIYDSHQPSSPRHYHHDSSNLTGLEREMHNITLTSSAAPSPPQLQPSPSSPKLQHRRRSSSSSDPYTYRVGAYTYTFADSDSELQAKSLRLKSWFKCKDLPERIMRIRRDARELGWPEGGVDYTAGVGIAWTRKGGWNLKEDIEGVSSGVDWGGSVAQDEDEGTFVEV